MAAAVEVLMSNTNVKETILNATDFTSLHRIISEGQDTYGMLSFDQCLFDLYQAGIISHEEALAQASQRDNLLLRIRGVGA